MEILGIDIGGSGVKGAPVEVQTGEFTRDRLKVATPEPAEPRAVAKAVAEHRRSLRLGRTGRRDVPGVVIDGVTHSAANLTDEWRRPAGT